MKQIICQAEEEPLGLPEKRATVGTLSLIFEAVKEEVKTNVVFVSAEEESNNSSLA